MKVAVSASGSSLQAALDPRFGRCACFVFVDTTTMVSDVTQNAAKDLDGGAGIQAARLVIDGGATVVLTGHCGPNAHRTLSAAGVRVVVGCSGSIGEAVEGFKAGKFTVAVEPNVGSHAGSPGPR